MKLLLLFVTTFSFAKEMQNQYTLSVTDANHHLAEVSVVFNNVVTRTLDVKIPVWRTGKYKTLDLPANIRSFKAYDANDKELTWHKVDKNTWRIFVNSPHLVKINYQIYANQLRNRVSHIDATHAYLDASGVFMYSESQRSKGLTVKLNVPKDWESVSGMDSIGKNKFVAANYDQLVDSPIETGIHHFDSIKVEEQLYEIVIWGDGNYDIEQLKTDIEKLHFQAKELWGSFPFKRYVYMYHAGDHLRGATEHVNSTIIQTDRLGFSPEKKYRKLIGTTAHEFIHTWNVKSYRPVGITPYDYSNENYSDLFWMAEGSTSYYDNLFLVRSKVYTLKQFFENLAEDIYKYKNKPGNMVMSLQQSSFDTWLGNDNNRLHNSTVSIYLKGSLVSWLLDKEIRQKTNNKKNLDDLHRLLYQRYENESKGYSSSDVKQLLKELTGVNFLSFWKDYVNGTREIQFEVLLDYYGLKFEKEKKDKLKKISLGIKIKDVNSLTEVTVVSKDGAGWLSGLTSGDKLVAINDMQVTYKNYNDLLESLTIDEVYSLHFFHDGKLVQTTTKPTKPFFDKHKIVPVTSPTKVQKLHFKKWTGQNLKDYPGDE